MNLKVLHFALFLVFPSANNFGKHEFAFFSGEEGSWEILTLVRQKKIRSSTGPKINGSYF
jgi:hypothetical protein